MKLGDTATDSVTGFNGMLTGRAEYLTGCVQYLVTPRKCKEDGSIPNGEWLDESRLTDVKSAPGGPQRHLPPSR